MFRPISGLNTQATAWLVAAILVPGLAAPAMAQAPGGNEMCGDGTTMTISLPRVANAHGESDPVEVPHGCSIYLVIASDYGRNRQFDELLFYPLAKYVAEHNGYVHYSWWNNFLQPYMGGVLRSNDLPTDPGPKTTIGALETVLGLDVIGEPGPDEVYLNDIVRKMLLTKGTIGLYTTLIEQVIQFYESFMVNVPTDAQFVSDAGFFIRGVRANHPANAQPLVFLAGHGFGAHAIVKVAQNAQNIIDLLAPIDPMGNSSLPASKGSLFERNVNPFTPNFNELKLDLGTYGYTDPQSRWRAVYDFKGYQQADCIRGGGPLGLLCKDFDDRFFFFQFECRKPNAADWQDFAPLIGSLKPRICPGPEVHAGTKITFKSNVGFLYHRYQLEWGPPLDFGSRYHYGFLAASISPTLQGPNVQGPVLPGNQIVMTPPTDVYIGTSQTCQTGEQGCQQADGHDEIAGFRGEPTFHLGADAMLTLTRRGVQARQWSNAPVSALNLRIEDVDDNDLDRRALMVEMASTTTNVTHYDCDNDWDDPGKTFWDHAPCSPDDCLVCGDLVTIATNLLAAHDGGPVTPTTPTPDTTAPSTTPTPDPDANANGWHQADVVVTLQAIDNVPGSGVREIHYSTPSGPTTEQGDVAHPIITAEGTTLLSFFATDNANNSGAPSSLEVKIDKTLPQIEAVTDVQPNASDWFKTYVTVSFQASDLLSGLASVTPPTLVELEGAGLEVEGTATDNADNRASASVTLNIDRTAPTITFASKTPDANAAGWHAADVTLSWNCADSLSRPAAGSVTETVTAEGLVQFAMGTCLDQAGNSASDTQGGINIDKTTPLVSINAPANGAVFLLNASVTSNYACSDSLSGVHSCSGPAASGSAANTSAVGSKQFLVNAIDVAGNTASATHSYSVRYGFSGFANPIGSMLNVVNAGRTVPVKYFLQDANGALITDLATFASLQSAATACDTSATSVLAEETTAPGSTEIRWDATLQQFQYNWNTDKAWAGTCRVLQLTLNDGTQHIALFKFR